MSGSEGRWRTIVSDCDQADRRESATGDPVANGRGEDSIVDTAVRNVWQIAPGAVKIGDKSWAANFESIVSKVKAGLGCQDAKISAELYKLLIYDRGGFFLAHPDTERTVGIFGILGCDADIHL